MVLPIVTVRPTVTHRTVAGDIRPIVMDTEESTGGRTIMNGIAMTGAAIGAMVGMVGIRMPSVPGATMAAALL